MRWSWSDCFHQTTSASAAGFLDITLKLPEQWGNWALRDHSCCELELFFPVSLSEFECHSWIHRTKVVLLISAYGNVQGFLVVSCWRWMILTERESWWTAVEIRHSRYGCVSLLYLVLMQVLVFVKVLCMNHVFGLCSDAYAIGKKEKPPFSPQNNPSSHPHPHPIRFLLCCCVWSVRICWLMLWWFPAAGAATVMNVSVWSNKHQSETNRLFLTIFWCQVSERVCWSLTDTFVQPADSQMFLLIVWLQTLFCVK